MLLCDRSNNCDNINQLRKELFTQKNKQFDSIPPTKEALLYAMYQAGQIWGKSTVPKPGD